MNIESGETDQGHQASGHSNQTRKPGIDSRPPRPEKGAAQGITAHKTGGMGQLAATAICGNDITSSCLYVSALAIIYAGR